MKKHLKTWFSVPANRNYCLLLGGLAVVIAALLGLCRGIL